MSELNDVTVCIMINGDLQIVSIDLTTVTVCITLCTTHSDYVTGGDSLNYSVGYIAGYSGQSGSFWN